MNINNDRMHNKGETQFQAITVTVFFHFSEKAILLKNFLEINNIIIKKNMAARNGWS
jgi:hypothetical protein